MPINLGFQKKEEVLKKIKSCLSNCSFDEVENIPYGVQVSLKRNEEPLGKIRIYENVKKGIKVDLSTILKESEREDLGLKLSEHLGVSSVGKEKLPQNFWLRNDAQIEEIKKEIEKCYLDRCKFEKPEHMVYAAKLNGLVISQWENGRLTIQGNPSPVADDLIEKIKNILESGVINLFIKNYERQFALGKSKEIIERIKKMEINLPINKKLFYYLYPNDQIEISDGLKVLEFVKQDKIKLDNYVSIVRGFAVAFEGFLIKLFMELNIINPNNLFRHDGEAKIGKILNTSKNGKSEFEERFGGVYLRSKPHLSPKLDSLWKECRNKYLHSDPLSPPVLDSLERAQGKINELFGVMEELFQLFEDKLYFEFTIDIDKLSCIGTDESGKGDYFGPLVVSAVFVEPIKAAKLITKGVMDSKMLTDKKIFELEKLIKETCDHDVVIIGPKKYNELYNKIKNLNKLLAWGHARAIENILSKTSCMVAVADQFGDENFINNALLEKGRTIKLIQTTKAERNISVAAASILARAEFIRSLDILSKELGVDLPKGSSNPKIQEIAKKILDNLGEDKIKEIAKIHFKTTKKIINAKM